MPSSRAPWRLERTFLAAVAVAAVLTVTLAVADRPQPSAALGTSWTAFTVSPAPNTPSGGVAVPIAVSSVAPIGSPGAVGSLVLLPAPIGGPNSVAITPDATTMFVLSSSGATAIVNGIPRAQVTPSGTTATNGIAVSPLDGTAWFTTTVGPSTHGLVEISPNSIIRTIPLPFTPGPLG